MIESQKLWTFTLSYRSGILYAQSLTLSLPKLHRRLLADDPFWRTGKPRIILFPKLPQWKQCPTSDWIVSWKGKHTRVEDII